jgi:hypothetical protein
MEVAVLPNPLSCDENLADPSSSTGMAKKNTSSPHEALIADLLSVSARLPSLNDVHDARAAKKARHDLERVARELHAAAATLDQVKRPASVFDPSNPAIVGRLIAMTLVAQERTTLGGLAPFYGSGVYAIYYKGDFPPYKGLSAVDHPLYVGKANPAADQARDPVSQGQTLFKRLGEHARSIKKTKNLKIEAFECRFLIVSSGWQTAAEDYLIRLFRPIWNTEIKIAFGIGKHGDAATTRLNGRSPWDTLHPGRPWADATDKDQKPLPVIISAIESHLTSHPPYKTTEDLFARFMHDMRQLPPATTDTAQPPSPPEDQ